MTYIQRLVKLPMINLSPQLLVIIPCLNEEGYLRGLVDYLLKSCDVDATRLVIADGGSTDGTPLIAQECVQRHKRVAYLYNSDRLQASAVNLAVTTYGQNATFLIRIDAHADYPSNYCRMLLDEALRTGADSVVVSMKAVGRTMFQRVVAVAQNSLLGNGGSAHRNAVESGCWVDHGHHALMRVTAFSAVGGYDESFAHNEDAELDYRLGQAGYKIWLTDKTSLIYYPRSTLAKLFTQYVNYGYGRARTIVKHRICLKLRHFLPISIIPIILVALISPWFELAALPLVMWLLLCVIYGVVLAFRTGEASMALAGPVAILMHIGWSLGFWRALLISWQPPT
jgi:succinoglycan biosynthesis protein ExoA